MEHFTKQIMPSIQHTNQIIPITQHISHDNIPRWIVLYHNPLMQEALIITSTYN